MWVVMSCKSIFYKEIVTEVERKILTALVVLEMRYTVQTDPLWRLITAQLYFIILRGPSR